MLHNWPAEASAFFADAVEVKCPGYEVEHYLSVLKHYFGVKMTMTILSFNGASACTKIVDTDINYCQPAFDEILYFKNIDKWFTICGKYHGISVTTSSSEYIQIAEYSNIVYTS